MEILWVVRLNLWVCFLQIPVKVNIVYYEHNMFPILGYNFFATNEMDQQSRTLELPMKLILAMSSSIKDKDQYVPHINCSLYWTSEKINNCATCSKEQIKYNYA